MQNSAHRKCTLFRVFVVTIGLAFGAGAETAEEPKPIPVSVVALKPGIWLEGEVCYSRTTDLGFENKGKIVEIKPVGYTAESAVYNGDGRTIRQGDVLAKIDPTLYEIEVKNCDAVVKSAIATLQEKQKNYERLLKLSKRGVTSAKQLEDVLEDFESAQADCDGARQKLIKAQYELEACNLRAPFYGQIETHYLTVGSWVGEGRNVVKFSLMSPVRVKVGLPQELANQITLNDSIVVHSLNSDTPFGVWFDEASVNANHISLYVRNQKVPVSQLPKKLEALHKVETLHFLTSFRNGQETGLVWAPVDCIRKESDGAYVVWKADKQKIALADTPISRTFQVKKIGVTPLDRFMYLGIYHYQALKKADNADLQRHDVLIGKPPQDLKDNETVVYSPTRWLFQPGDRVRVSITPCQKPGFYVPSDYINHEKSGKSVYVAVNGTAAKVKVEVVDDFGGFSRIKSSSVKDGTLLIIPNHKIVVMDGSKIRAMKKRDCFFFKN